MALSSATKEIGELRNSWTDPDLVDNSPDESGDRSTEKQKHPERVNREFSDPDPLNKSATKKRKNRRPIDPSSCGAYRRPNGRWSSEIRSGSARFWLGTFDTKEEARTAYLSKKMEIEATSGGDGSAKTKGKLEEPYPGVRKLSWEWSAVMRDPIKAEEGKAVIESKKFEFAEKKVKLEMEELVASPSSVQAFGSSDTGGSGESIVQGPATSERKSQRSYPGVRNRRGKWSAEVRDPFKKSKVWLGTFGSPEEARAAIEAKKLEFDARKLNPEKGKSVASPILFQFESSDSGGRDGGDDGSAEECGLAAEDDGSAKELAVLKRFTEGCGGHDLKYVLQIASDIIDSNGNFLGEFSSLDDDLQIR